MCERHVAERVFRANVDSHVTVHDEVDELARSGIQILAGANKVE
jgi:hypothetical protein